MRKTLIQTLIATLALAGLAACSADVGSRGDTLRAVDEGAMTSQLLYLRTDLSPFPMTAADLAASGQDATLAIPVRVEVFDTMAVAWFAPGGEARVNRDGIMAIWDVAQRTPIAGELDNNAEIGVVEPGDAPIFIGDLDVGGLDPSVAIPTEQIGELPTDGVARTILDFYDILSTEQEAAFLARLGALHPGCL